MRRCLPGLSAGLVAMFAVITNRLLSGFLLPLPFAQIH